MITKINNTTFSSTFKVKRCLVINFFILLLVFPELAFTQNLYRHYAESIYYFTKYIHWPGEPEELVIATLGESPLGEELHILEEKLAGEKKIIIKKFKSVAEVTHCHILFVTSSMEHDLKSLAVRAKNEHILLLSEVHDGAKKGAVINFVHQAHHIHFELNTKVAELYGLKISSKLQKLTTIVG